MKNSLFRWVGSKKKVLKYLNEEFERYFKGHEKVVYIEPFIGSGTVLFNIIEKYRDSIEYCIVNDINKGLINCYKNIKENPNILYNEILNIENEYLKLSENNKKDYFYIKRKEYNASNLNNEYDAALFMFLNKTCYAGLYRENSKGEFNTPFQNDKKIEHIISKEELLYYSSLLSFVEFRNGDFSNIETSRENSIFYFDPPYKPIFIDEDSFSSYTKEKFVDLDQERLKEYCDLINSCNNCFLLSNSCPDFEYFENLYECYTIKKVEIRRTLSRNSENRKKLYENLIMNF